MLKTYLAKVRQAWTLTENFSTSGFPFAIITRSAVSTKKRMMCNQKFSLLYYDYELCHSSKVVLSHVEIKSNLYPKNNIWAILPHLENESVYVKNMTISPSACPVVIYLLENQWMTVSCKQENSLSRLIVQWCFRVPHWQEAIDKGISRFPWFAIVHFSRWR